MAVIWILLPLLISMNTSHAQQRNIRTEILVYILPDSLELPRQIKNMTPLQNALVRSSSLGRTLREIKATGIGRAFPNWPQNDTTMIREDGVPVKMPSFHRIFTLSFSDEKERKLL